MRYSLKITSRKKLLGLTVHTHIDTPAKTFSSENVAHAWAASWIVLNELRNYDIEVWMNDN